MQPLFHRLSRTGTLALTIAMLLLTTADAPRSVRAASMVVNTLADTIPPATDGLCSLREAMTNANTNANTHPDCPAGAGADTITFSVSGPIALAGSLPVVVDAAGLIISGYGVEIALDGRRSHRILHVNSGAALDIRGLTLLRGKAPEGGAIRTSGTLLAFDVIIRDNETDGGAVSVPSGSTSLTRVRLLDNQGTSIGALQSLATLTMVDSEVVGNSGTGTGGVNIHSGSANFSNTKFLLNRGTGWGSAGALSTGYEASVNLSDSFFGGNTTSGAGAGVAARGTLSVARSAFVANYAAHDGGGMFTYGLATVTKSLFWANYAGTAGGGFHTEGISTIANSTFSGNEAGFGGGVFASYASDLSLQNTTVTQNLGTQAGGGIAAMATGTTITRLRNSITAGNTAPVNADCSGRVGTAPDVAGMLTQGANILGIDGGCAFTGPQPILADPLLAPLADNGGPTWTHALLPGSPALNVGDPAICAAPPVNGIDQRGVTRPQGTECDLGAYEATPVGGRHLRVSAALGQVALGWDTGTDQTGYTLLTYNTATASTSLASLPAHAVAYTHAGATNGVLYCHVLAAIGPSGLLGLSDLECGLPGAQSGAAIAGDFTLSLHGTANASLTWQSPTSGVESYLLVRIPLDGTAPTNVPLPGATTASTQPLPAAGACFQLVAYQSTAHGVTNVLCGVPGVSTLGARGRVASLTDAERLLADRTVSLSTIAGHMRPMLSP